MIGFYFNLFDRLINFLKGTNKILSLKSPNLIHSKQNVNIC